MNLYGHAAGARRAAREAPRQPEIALAAVVLRPVVLNQRLAGPRSLRGALQELPERLVERQREVGAGVYGVP